MNIYLIEQSYNNDYDTYDSAVVAAESIEAAKLMHPRDGSDIRSKKGHFLDWVLEPEKVEVTLIGTTDISEAKVICASFNAG